MIQDYVDHSFDDVKMLYDIIIILDQKQTICIVSIVLRGRGTYAHYVVSGVEPETFVVNREDLTTAPRDLNSQ